MKKTNKSKSLVAIVVTVIMVGIFVYFNTTLKKTIDYQKTQLKQGVVGNNPSQTDNQNSSIESIKQPGKKHIQTTSPIIVPKEESTATKIIVPKEKVTSINNMLRDDMGISLEDIPFSSMSQLPVREQEKAINSFTMQHDSWLTIQDGSARYKITVRALKNGKPTQIPTYMQTGTIEFLVKPLDNPIKFQSPAKIQTRIFDDQSKLTVIQENVFDSEASSWQWPDNHASDINNSINKKTKVAPDLQPLFLPIDFMAKTYSDVVWHNKYTMSSKDDYFAGQGLPIRMSTSEETKQIFGEEPQYLFLASPSLTDAHYWFSDKNSELRQIDVFTPNKAVISFRYENYTQGNEHGARFPQRFTMTWKKGDGNKVIDREYTIELMDVKLNEGISSEKFIPPSYAK